MFNGADIPHATVNTHPWKDVANSLKVALASCKGPNRDRLGNCTATTRCSTPPVTGWPPTGGPPHAASPIAPATVAKPPVKCADARDNRKDSFGMKKIRKHRFRCAGTHRHVHWLMCGHQVSLFKYQTNE